MKKLRTLFSPRALATTVAAGMLLHTTITVLAADCISVSTSTGTNNCNEPYETFCPAGAFYWCCPYPYSQCGNPYLLSDGTYMGGCKKPDGSCP
jgi:hypothetical protein